MRESEWTQAGCSHTWCTQTIDNSRNAAIGLARVFHPCVVDLPKGISMNLLTRV